MQALPPAPPAACLVVGDSVAVGLAAALARLGIACDVAARVGASTAAVAAMADGTRRDAIYVSAGSNDAGAPDLARRLAVLGSRLVATRVVWILPRNRRAAALVSAEAAATGGLVLDAALQPSRDGVHPADYRLLALRALR